MVITNEATYIEFTFAADDVLRIAKNSADYRHQDEDYIKITTVSGTITIDDASYVSSIVDNVNVATVNTPGDLATIAAAIEAVNFLYN